ncbi:Ctr copper transporter family-domain-containing protein [Phakopsora pachyrhizi]|uniref:Copper transport protein n=1 Tax=Phakopsora pachyrhizi TaxID=170000 RepID=A0AAV0B8I8_PHAPC|nr:Ctr copper transporter family-domain-containing protein [Phakopsora pachyrhizi]
MDGMSMDHMSMDGMDMSSDHSPMMMTYFFAGVPSVPLWFSGWVPKNGGAVFGACVGLFLLSALAKLLEAYRHQAHLAWSQPKWHDSGITQSSATEKLADGHDPTRDIGIRRSIQSTPWNLKREISRGVLSTVQVTLGYFLMLAVMTFNVYFFLAIILGHFAGEVSFGRLGSADGGGHRH